MTSAEYIRELKKLTETGSLYAVAKLMRVSEQAVHGYAKGQRFFDQYACLRVSELLNIPFEKVIADIELERETDPAKRAVWSDLLRKCAAVLITVTATILGFGGSYPTEAAAKFGTEVRSADLTRYKLYAERLINLWARFLWQRTRLRGFGT